MCQVSEWVTRVREEVRRQLPPDAEDAEQVLMAVQEELLKELLENEPGLQVGSRVLQESDFAEAKENLKERDNSASLSEEWQEKRFLRFSYVACFSLVQQFLFPGSWKLMMR